MWKEAEGRARSIASETWLVRTTEWQRRGSGGVEVRAATSPDQLLPGPLYKFKTGRKNVTVAMFRVPGWRPRRRCGLCGPVQAGMRVNRESDLVSWFFSQLHVVYVQTMKSEMMADLPNRFKICIRYAT